jgi:CubicO group peptidase (beta-lactamase class C family)
MRRAQMTPERSRRSILSAVAAVSAILSSACTDSTGPSDRDDIGAWMDFYDVPGVSVAVIKDFALDYVEVHGVKSRDSGEPVSEHTLFQAASLTKGVSAMGVVSLAQDEVVSLDADVNDYLTSWQVPENAYQAVEKVTLRRLLSHTAGTTVHGFRGYRYTEAWPTLVQILDGEPPANSPPVVVARVPGSAYSYSGGGYEIADLVVRDVTGSTFAEFIGDRVLDPLGMSESTFEQPLPAAWLDLAASGYYQGGIPVPGRHHVYPETAAAALWTTPSDYARFLIELQLSLRGESNQVLTRENTELLVTEVMDSYGLGLGLRTIRGEKYIWHAGANDGFRGGMLAHPELGYGLVVLTNSDYGDALTEAVIELVGRRELWPGFRPGR